MVSPARRSEAARSEVADALRVGRRRSPTSRTGSGPVRAVLSMQRRAGNQAVTALMLGRARSPGDAAREDLDVALAEVRRDEPAVDLVETGLKRAQAAGVPVDLEGVKPPPLALAVTKTGFGPAQVASKRAKPPTKAVPRKSPLATAGGAAAKRRAGPATKGLAVTRGAPAAGAVGVASPSGAAPSLAPSLAPDQLLRPPVPPTPMAPERDPQFAAVTMSVAGFGKATRAHPPARAKAAEAQGAALAPSGDVPAQAKAAKADAMDAQQPGDFDKKGFIAAVKTAIEATSPSTLTEADDYQASGRAGEVKGAVQGLVTQGKQEQSRDIEDAAAAAPDPSTAVTKPVTPLETEDPGQPVTIHGAGAAPRPAPAEQTNLQAGKHQADAELAGADVDEKQLTESNEPEFQQAVTDKKAAAAHADTAPVEFRAQEQQVLAQGKAEATAQTTAGVAGMQGAKAAAVATLIAGKGKAKAQDEATRSQVTTKIQSLFDATETAVKAILDGIDPKVEKTFEKGEAGARATFEKYVAAKMSAYKKDRYGGWLGGIRWAKDKLLGMPSKVEEFYQAGRELYLKKMNGVIEAVAGIVGGSLTTAKARIAKGRCDIASYVKGLPADLRTVGSQASQEIGEGFARLEKDVDAKQDAVVDALATRYVEARTGLDERIEALQAENKGLVDKAIGAIKAVVNTIRELTAMLTNVLARVAGVVGQIVKAPVAFLGNLIAGVKGGIIRFKDNILTHLRNGLMGWLFGALAEGGVELPETFDVKGIVKLLASIFGLTWTSIRGRLVRQIGERAMGAAERGVGIFQTIATEGVGGLWQMLVERLGDIKEMILGQVKDFVVTKIITAGITWLIGLLNPAAAFIKACKLIYDVVMFFVNNASRIAAFVNTVIDSVADIVRGNVSGVVAKIENVLGQMVPIIIGFLASVIGLGGVGQKIREIIGALRRPVTRAMDFLIKKGLQLAGPIIRGLKGVGSRVKARAAAGKAWAKGKVDSGAARVRGRIRGGRESRGDGPRLGPSGVKDAARRALAGKLATVTSGEELRGLLQSVMNRLRPAGLERLRVVPGRRSGAVEVHAEASPGEKVAEGMPNLSLDLSDIDLTTRQNRFVTVAKGILDGTEVAIGRNNTPVAADADLSTVEQQGRHAEASVLDTVSTMVVLDRASTRGPHRLELYVTRSPCNACTDKIARVRRLFEAGGGHLDVVVRTLAVYQGARDPARHAATGRGTAAAGTYSLMRLREMGVQVEAWDVRRDARKIFGPGVDLHQAAAVASNLDRKVQQLKGVLFVLSAVDLR